MGSRISKPKFLDKPNSKSTKLTTNIKGTIGEYQEIVNLTKQGFWVAKACDPQCPFDLITVSPDSKTSEAVEIMSTKGVGCLPVVSDDGKLLGLVTERSIVMVAKMTCRFD